MKRRQPYSPPLILNEFWFDYFVNFPEYGLNRELNELRDEYHGMIERGEKLFLPTDTYGADK